MKRVIETAIFALCLALCTQAATVPVQNMTPFSLSAEYMGILNGHLDMYEFDASAIGSHFIRLHYAPNRFLRFTGGVGGSHYYNAYELYGDGRAVEGLKAGISATAGLGLYLTRFVDWLSLTAGYDGYYLKASHGGNIIDSRTEDRIVFEDGEPNTVVDTLYSIHVRDGETIKALHTPYMGVIFHLGRYVDLGLGGQYHYAEVIKKTARHRTGDYRQITNTYDLTEGVYSRIIENRIMEQVRLYSTLTFHDRGSGAYISGGFSTALTNRLSEDRSYLTDFSFWAQVGLTMHDPRGNNVRGARTPRHGDSYTELKMRQERMAGMIERDFRRDRQRAEDERRALRRCKNHKHDEQGRCLVDNRGNYIPKETGEDVEMIIVDISE
jgi:hypothetical protein